MCEADELPSTLPRDGDAKLKQEFLSKLAEKVVDTVFVKPENVDRVLKLAGESSTRPKYCVCDGGITTGTNIFLRYNGLGLYVRILLR